MYQTILRIFLGCIAGFYSISCFSQSALTSLGSDHSGSGGSISFSGGQLVYSQYNSDEWDFSQGVQQAFEITVLTADQNDKPNITVYPNPTLGSLIIEHQFAVQPLVVLRDVNGKILKSDFIATNAIDLTDLPSGLYFLSVVESMGYSHTFKIVKQN